MSSPDQPEPVIHEARSLKQVVLASVFLLFYGLLFFAGLAAFIQERSSDEYDLPESAPPSSKLHLLFRLTVVLLFAIGGIRSAFRFRRGAKFGFYELLALAVGLLLGVFILYTWIFL